jgi:hypothetical protein
MTVDRRACLEVLAGSLGTELGSGDTRFGEHHTESTRSVNNVLNYHAPLVRGAAEVPEARLTFDGSVSVRPERCPRF